MKKILSLLLATVICLTLAACGHKVKRLIKDIAMLEGRELKLSDEDYVDDLYKTYLSLSEEEQAQVTNFELLDTASKRVNFLSARQDLMQEIYYRAATEWVKSCLKTPSTMEVLKIEVYPAYDSMWYAFASIHFTAENGYGGKVEQVYFAQLERVGPNTYRAERSYKGDAHATWEDVDWLDAVWEEIDYEHKYVPGK